MILDHLDQQGLYHRLHPLFPEAFAFLARADLASLAPGKTELVKGRLYAIVERGPGRAAESARLEAHRRFIDIQVVLEGRDLMGWRPTSACHDEMDPYDEERDIVFFRDAPLAQVAVHPRHFVVFFPSDAHQPSVSEGLLHKIVMKIAVE